MPIIYSSMKIGAQTCHFYNNELWIHVKVQVLIQIFMGIWDSISEHFTCVEYKQ